MLKLTLIHDNPLAPETDADATPVWINGGHIIGVFAMPKQGRTCVLVAGGSIMVQEPARAIAESIIDDQMYEIVDVAETMRQRVARDEDHRERREAAGCTGANDCQCAYCEEFPF